MVCAPLRHGADVRAELLGIRYAALPLHTRVGLHTRARPQKISRRVEPSIPMIRRFAVHGATDTAGTLWRRRWTAWTGCWLRARSFKAQVRTRGFTHFFSISTKPRRLRGSMIASSGPAAKTCARISSPPDLGHCVAEASCTSYLLSHEYECMRARIYSSTCTAGFVKGEKLLATTPSFGRPPRIE